MPAEKEKSQLMVEILQEFAPYMDQSANLFREMGVLITNFGTLVESFHDLPDEKKIAFMEFIRHFNNYIEHASNNYTELNKFYGFIAEKTTVIIADYKALMGLD